jgi:glycosyltransferase involved in cell wall biosynthesis
VKSILLVAQEFSPLTRGGIGKLLRDQADYFVRCGHNVSVLLLGLAETNYKATAINPELIVHCATDLLSNESTESEFEALIEYARNEQYKNSLICAFAIKKLFSQGNNYDIIEFPDYEGLAFISSNMKKAGDWPDGCVIAIRLHSTMYMLREFDTGYQLDLNEIYALEIESLKNADLVIGHTQSVCDSIEKSLEKLNIRIPKPIVTFPYISFDYISDDKVNKLLPIFSIFFTSKLQHFKRPLVFLKGSLLFLAKVKNRNIDIVFMARMTDLDIIEKLKKVIPVDFESNIVYLEEERPEVRNKKIKGQISVFASEYESFCLAAYEASMAGSIPFLNSNNPSFDSASRWTDKLNCIKFDGTAYDLSRKLLEYASDPFELNQVEVNQDCIYCDLNTIPPVGNIAVLENKIDFTVLIPHFNKTDKLEVLLETLQKFRMFQPSPNAWKILIVDDCSHQIDQLKLKKIVDKFKDLGIELLENEINLGLSASRNIGISQIKSEYIYFIDADDLPTENFLRQSLEVLQKHPDTDLVMGQTALFVEDADYWSLKISAIANTFGLSFFAGWKKNSMSSSSFVLRRSIAESLKFDETLEVFEDWDFLLRLIEEDVKSVVLPIIGVWYRQSNSGMLQSASPLSKQIAVDRMFSKEKVRIPGRIHFDSLLTSEIVDWSKKLRLLNIETHKSKMKNVRNLIIVKFPRLESTLLRLSLRVRKYF